MSKGPREPGSTASRGLPRPAPHDCICHTPHSTSRQMTQKMDTLTQHDSDVVTHHSSKPRSTSTPRPCSDLMALEVEGREAPGTEAKLRIPGGRAGGVSGASGTHGRQSPVWEGAGAAARRGPVSARSQDNDLAHSSDQLCSVAGRTGIRVTMVTLPL